MEAKLGRNAFGEDKPVELRDARIPVRPERTGYPTQLRVAYAVYSLERS